MIAALVALSASTALAAERVTADQLGADWPFEVDEAMFDCEKRGDIAATTVEIGGKTYAFTGAGQAAGFPSVSEAPELKPFKFGDQVIEGAHANVGPAGAYAKRLCD